MFNLGPAGIVVLLLLALIFLGARKRPELAVLVRSRARAPLAPGWSWSDWFLVCAAICAGAVALQLTAGVAR